MEQLPDTLPDGAWEDVSLPHTWYSDEDPYQGLAVYERTIAVDAAWQRAFLSFDGADQRCRVSVNGHFAGEHCGGYSRFRLPVPASAMGDDAWHIQVFLENSVNEDIAPSFGDFTVFGGLYRNVGRHTFTYAFTAWEGDFLNSPVVREAYDLNVPLRVAAGGANGFSAFSLDAQNVFIDTVKPAEDGSGDLILRLYEAKQADTCCALSIKVPARRVWDCDMLENKLQALALEGDRVDLTFHTFEVKTLRLEF